MDVTINQRSETKWTSYLATGIAEGFEEGTLIQTIEAWAYLIKTKLAYSLQGFFGRQATELIDRGLISADGEINWDNVDELIINNN